MPEIRIKKTADRRLDKSRQRIKTQRKLIKSQKSAVKPNWFVRWLPRGLAFFSVVSFLGAYLTVQTGWLDKTLNVLVEWFFWPLPSFSFTSGCIFAVLAIACKRRKRVAWWVMVFLTAGVGLFFFIAAVILLSEFDKDLSLASAQVVFNTGLMICLLVLLLVNRKQFFAKIRPANYGKAFAIMLAGGIISFAIVGISREMTQDTSQALFPDWMKLTQNLVLNVRSDEIPYFYWTILSLLFAITFVLAFWVLLRSQKLEARLSVEDEEKIRQLLADYPSDSLAYFTTRRDKSVFFGPKCAILYRVVNGIGLASGDPIGERGSWNQTVADFVAHCYSYGWSPAVLAASENGARAYQNAGLRVLGIGDEAILTRATFRRTSLPDVDRAVRKIEKLGYQLRIRRHKDVSDSEMVDIKYAVDKWRQGNVERGFSMALGRLGDLADQQCLLVEALFPKDHDMAGKPAGILSFVPWGGDGVSLDLMRRHPRVDPGINEFMVVGLMQSGGDFGIRRVSLNFAVLREGIAAGEKLGAGPLKRVYRKVLLFLSRWWQLESLYRSNQKYDPTWVPRLMCFEDAGKLGPVAVAAAIAEGFMSLPGRKPELQPALNQAQAEKMNAITALCEEKTHVRVPEQIRFKTQMRADLLDRGIQPYPDNYLVTSNCAKVIAAAKTGKDITGSSANTSVRIAGRVVRIRNHGKVIFIDLQDNTGQLQLLFSAAKTTNFGQLRKIVRIGDQLGVSGSVGFSRTGTCSLLVDSFQLTSKALRPLPGKHHGITDPETRVRKRYLDLIVNLESVARLKSRSKAIQAVRNELLAQGFLEVETPILQTIHGGANARPFRTHINAYDLDLYLRIAPELFLKRLIVGGMDRIFEIGRNFRNEGADATHNPEFSMLEAYQTYCDYRQLMPVAKQLVVRAAQEANGTTILRGEVGNKSVEVDLAKDWPVVRVTDGISLLVGENVADFTVLKLRNLADKLKISYHPQWGWGELITEIYEQLLESSTVQPTFYCDFPAETSPLTRQHDSDPRFAQRWDLVGFGMELGTAYSELVDPVIQRERLTSQSLAAAGGDREAMELDEDFLEALEYGMPPTGGLGMGLDRLVMWLTNSSIRETIAFPLVRPR